MMHVVPQKCAGAHGDCASDLLCEHKICAGLLPEMEKRRKAYARNKWIGLLSESMATRPRMEHMFNFSESSMP